MKWSKYVKRWWVKWRSLFISSVCFSGQSGIQNFKENVECIAQPIEVLLELAILTVEILGTEKCISMLHYRENYHLIIWWLVILHKLITKWDGWLGFLNTHLTDLIVGTGFRMCMYRSLKSLSVRGCESIERMRKVKHRIYFLSFALRKIASLLQPWNWTNNVWKPVVSNQSIRVERFKNAGIS
jgi:hypothetical protein